MRKFTSFISVITAVSLLSSLVGMAVNADIVSERIESPVTIAMDTVEVASAALPESPTAPENLGYSRTIRYTLSANTSDATGELQRFLDQAKSVGDDVLIEINIPAGTYYIESVLMVYSNTSIKLASGAKLARSANNVEHALMISASDTGNDANIGGYNLAKNIFLSGGTFDGNSNNNQNCHDLIRFNHCQNIIIKDASFVNCIRHTLNLSGCNKLLISGCTFGANVTYNGTSRDFYINEPNPTNEDKIGRHRTVESIHLDFMTAEGETDAFKLDGTAPMNITVRGCTFSGCNRGVGTHHNTTGTKGSKILIENNTFTNIRTRCISAFSYNDMTVRNNTATNVGCFIYTDTVNRLSLTGNTVSGIIDTSHEFNEPIEPMWLADASNITVSGNNIDSNGASPLNIRVQNANTVMISSNTLAGSVTNAIYIGDSQAVTVSDPSGSAKSSITTRGQTPITVYNSDATIDSLDVNGSFHAENSTLNLRNNRIRGRVVVTRSRALRATGNNINSDGNACFTLNNLNGPADLTGNTLSSSGTDNTIYVNNRGQDINISGNTFENAVRNYIYIENSDSVNISGNHMDSATSTAQKAISVNGSSGVAINSNTMTAFSNHAVYCSDSTLDLTGNTVEGCALVAKNGSDVNVSDNDIAHSGNSDMLVYLVGSTGSFDNNSFADAPKGIQMDGCNDVSISNNSFDDMRNQGIQVLNGSSNISITGNTHDMNDRNFVYISDDSTNVTVTTPTPEPTAAPTATPTASPTSSPSSSGVDGFVERLYTIALGRSSDPAGQAAWVSTITSGENTGADVARGFLYSDEFLNKNMSNEDFVRVLYRTFFDREADASGLAAWVGVLDQGESKQNVIEGFINSTEWANVCLRFGIASGGTGTANIDVEPNEATIGFATRLYTTCLNRDADQGGLMAWARQLANQRDTGTGAARGFFFSSEFLNQNVDNGEYVTRLYRTFMGREPDQAGYDAWVGQLEQGVSREEVFDGFSQSSEFTEICRQYGIIRG